MNKQITTYLIIAILCIVIGLLLHPVFFNGKTEPPIVTPVAPDSTFMTGAPDTFWVEAETIYKPRYIYQDTGSVRTIIDTQYVARERPIMNSYKHFDHSKFVTSEVWTKSLSPVFDISNSVVVDWQEHYNDNYRPQIDIKLKDEKKHSLIKGLAAGAIFTAGLATGDWRIAAGGTAGALGIIIIF